MEASTPFGLMWWILMLFVLTAAFIELRGAFACLVDGIVDAWRQGRRHMRSDRD
jgi:hypothetical protein